MQWRYVSKAIFCLLFLLFVAFIDEGFSGSLICVPKEQAKDMVVELEQKRILEDEIVKSEMLIQNLKKQNELLREQMKLLQEQIRLLQEQKQFYERMVEEKDKEIRGMKVKGFFQRIGDIGLGAVVGIVIGIIAF